MKCEWKSILAKDFIEFNPKITLKKGTIAKKVAMDKVLPYTKYINEFEYTNYTGGSKFQNGDTIMARITPCLENGKTAFIDFLDENEVGFGSTEFIVLRERKGISDAQYIYYLSISPQFRKIAISSMVGSSGRQRVQQSVLDELELFVPDINEQRRIANILNKIDEKIRINNRINDNLEHQMQNLFNKLFINNFPNDEKIIYQNLGELVEIIDNRGKTPPIETAKTEYPIIDVKSLSGNSRIVNYNQCSKYVSQKTYSSWFRNGHPKNQDILISTVGSLAEIKLFLGSKGCIAQNVVAFRSYKISPYYLYQYLLTNKDKLIAYNIGSVQPSIKVSHIIKHPIYIPEKKEIETFDFFAKRSTNIIYNNTLESEYLSQLRNILLPKLITGKIDIKRI